MNNNTKKDKELSPIQKAGNTIALIILIGIIACVAITVTKNIIEGQQPAKTSYNWNDNLKPPSNSPYWRNR